MFFKKLNQYFIECTSKLNQLALQKYQFIKKINYQVHKLIVMMTLKFSEEKNIQSSKFALVQTIDLDQIFTDSQISFLKRLFGNKQHLLNYQDICQYLCVSTSIGNKYVEYQIEKQDLQTFIHIIKTQKQAIQDFIFSILEHQNIRIQQLFDEIDFFNNGYINASSIIQFINHYKFQSQKNIQIQSKESLQKYEKQKQAHINKRQKQFSQKGCQILLKYIKGSLKGEKVFLKDFQQFFNFLQKTQPEQQTYYSINKNIPISEDVIKIQQNNVDFLKSHFHVISQESLIRKNNNKQKNKHNRCNIQQQYLDSPIKGINNLHENLQCQNQQSKVFSKLNLKVKNSLPIHSQRLQFGQSQICVSFQDKMIQTFKRNQAYIKEIKRKQQFYPQIYQQSKPNKFQSKNILFDSSKEKYQFIFGMQVLANQFFNKKNMIQRLINEYPKFTLLNAFNVIDYSQNSKVNYQEFKTFLNDCQIQKSQTKVNLFFTFYSKLDSENVKFMNFSSFCKIFKLKSFKNQFVQLKKRKPLIHQNWTRNMKAEYCSFIRNIIDIQFNIHKAKKGVSTLYQKLNEKKYLIEDILEKQIVKSTDLKSILGQNSQVLIAEITKQNFFDINQFEKFINN